MGKAQKRYQSERSEFNYPHGRGFGGITVQLTKRTFRRRSGSCAEEMQRWRGRTGDTDIHVHAHDHIEWDRVLAELGDADAEIVERNDHLMFHNEYDESVWERWRDRTCDQSGVIARRRPVS